MNWLFWSLVPAAVGVFLVIAWLTDRALCVCERIYRRWACRREMARGVNELRARLEGAATAQDRLDRRIH